MYNKHIYTKMFGITRTRKTNY